MKFEHLPYKFQQQAIQNAIDAWNDLYNREGVDRIATKDSLEVKEYLDEHDYDVEVIKIGRFEERILRIRSEY